METTPMLRMAGKGGGGVNEDGLLSIGACGCDGQREWRLLWLLGMSDGAARQRGRTRDGSATRHNNQQRGSRRCGTTIERE